MDLSQIGNWFKNTGSTIGNKLKTGYQTYSPKVGNFLSNNRDTLIGGLGGGILGALDNGTKANLIKSSYYKNPYLNSALTPEYGLNDTINNLVGLLGMYGGGTKNRATATNTFGYKPLSLSDYITEEDDIINNRGLQGLRMSGDNNQPFVSPIKNEEDDYYLA